VTAKPTNDKSPEQPAEEFNLNLSTNAKIGVLAVLVAVIVALFVVGGNDSSAPSSTTVVGTTTTLPQFPKTVLDDKGVKTLLADESNPSYWVGPMQGYTYVVQRFQNGINIQYFPAGQDALKGGVADLQVVTYPVPDAVKVLEAVAKSKGNYTKTLVDGSLFMLDNSEPRRGYVAIKGADVQIELYSPDPSRVTQVAENMVFSAVAK
jgi:hypothetical protein